MKRVLPIFLLFFSAISNAQITKGSFLFGGALSVGHSVSRNPGPDNNGKNSNFLINPSIGKAIANNTILGVGFKVGHSRSGNSAAKSTSNDWDVNAYLRNYLPIGSGFNLFAQTDAFYRETRMHDSGPTYFNIHHTKAMGLNFQPGLDYAVSRRFHLELAWNDLFTVSFSNQTTNSSSSGGYVRQKWLTAYTNSGGTNAVVLGFRLLFSK
ncbi:MAG TPA: hypothetical protein VNR87_11855 [Flavisolibacter sp.]|nr:hypothetical protein [Flavisolibacter sp.]